MACLQKTGDSKEHPRGEDWFEGWDSAVAEHLPGPELGMGMGTSWNLIRHSCLWLLPLARVRCAAGWLICPCCYCVFMIWPLLLKASVS